CTDAANSTAQAAAARNARSPRPARTRGVPTSTSKEATVHAVGGSSGTVGETSARGRPGARRGGEAGATAAPGMRAGESQGTLGTGPAPRKLRPGGGRLDPGKLPLLRLVA